MSGTHGSRFVTRGAGGTHGCRFVSPAYEVRHHTGVSDWTRCGVCGEPLAYYSRPMKERRGRTPDYCGGACRQAAYRIRRKCRDNPEAQP